jgi:hypothetical protein
MSQFDRIEQSQIEAIAKRVLATAKFQRITLENNEFIKNNVDGRIDMMPAPHPAGDFGVYFDMTSSAYYAKVGTIDSSGNLNTNAGFQFDNTIAVAASKYADFGNTGGLISYYATSGSNKGVWQFAPFGPNSDHSMSLCLVAQNGLAAGNRRPTTAHTNPTFYVYAAGSANANDFVRLSHDGSNGTMEAGRGVMTLAGASGVRVNGSYGFGVAPTAVATGYTTFTNLTTVKTCNADSTSVAELADILGTLIVDLKAKGIVT